LNENTCVVVQCWEGDAHQVEQLLPFWQHHQVPVYLQSPADSKVKSPHPDVQALHAGKRGWSGHHTIDRQILHFEQMLDLPYDWFFYTDADAICLSAQFPQEVYSGEFWSNCLSTYDFWTKVYSYSEDDRDGERELQVKEACKYLGAIDNGTLDIAKWHQRCPIVMQPPYFVPRAILEQFVSTAKMDVWANPLDPPDDFPIPFIDWFYPALCRHGGIPGRGFAFDGVSMPTWHRHWLQRAENQIQAGGGRFVHSVKDMHVAQSLYDKWQERRREDEDQTFRFEMGGPIDNSEIGGGVVYE
jgi:hypothetical protein